MINELLSAESLLLMSLVVCMAAMIQAALGMGYGMAAAPLLALINPAFVPVPTIMIGMITSTAGAWSERQTIRWREVWIATAGRLTGIVLACLAISVAIDESRFILVFGLFIGVAVVLSASRWRLTMSKSTLYAMGSLSGLMGTITGVGAPPMALIYSSRSAESARPTLAATFSLGCGFSVLGLTLVGWVGPLQLLLCASMLPAMVIGTLIGRRATGFAANRYRPALLSIAGVAAIMLIFRGLS